MQIDILNQAFDVKKNLLIEASAGTGKTFTIEHLVVRHILEGTLPEKIAIVTFTKAVASELFLRIQSRIQKIVIALDENPEEYDFLMRYTSTEKKKEAKKLLQHALCMIDAIQIKTIHGFCLQLLKNHFSQEMQEKCFAGHSDLMLLIDDFFLTELNDQIISEVEIEKLFQAYRHDQEAVYTAIIRGLWKKQEYTQVTIQTFIEKKEILRKKGYTEEWVSNMLYALIDCSNGCVDRKGVVKANIQKQCMAFSALFKNDTIEGYFEEPLLFKKLFSERKKKLKKIVPEEVECFYRTCVEELDPITEALIDPEKIIIKLVQKIKPFVLDGLRKKNYLVQESLLEEVFLLLENSSFLLLLKKSFSVLIVDEFQDTDPIQWAIFQKGFLNQGTIVQLVGDPKQAIYAFRDADVYSYIEAKNSFSKEELFILNTNYRASLSMVRALNRLFHKKAQGLFSLPKKELFLEFPEIKSPLEQEEQEEAIIFLIATGQSGKKRSWPLEETEKEIFFPEIARKIGKFYQDGMPFKDIAILAKDRYQLHHIKDYLEGCGIPISLWRATSVIDTSMFILFKRLVQAVRSPRNKNYLRQLFLTPFFPVFRKSAIGDDLEEWACDVRLLDLLKKTFEEKGIACFLELFLEDSWGGNCSLRDAIKASSEGAFRLMELEALFDLLIAYEDYFSRYIDRLFDLLLDFEGLSQEEKDRFIVPYPTEKDAVSLLTMHKSKGLEFQVVFALGVASRSLKRIEDDDALAEKMRTFYVTCTRAKKKLYIPLPIDLDVKECSKKSASLIELFLGHIDHSSNYAKSLEETITLLRDLQQGCPEIGIEELSEDTYVEKLQIPERKKELFSLGLWQLPFFREMTSATKMMLKVQKTHVSDFSKAPLDNLQIGKETGIFIHLILQELIKELSLGYVLLNELQIWVEKRLLKTVYEESKERVIEIFKQLFFHTPFMTSTEVFFLHTLDWQRVKTECNFFQKESATKYIHGSIDFCFFYNDKYYVIDWKMHSLHDYDQKALLDFVEKEGYLIQKSVYSTACSKMFKDAFGGFFFVFLRGIDSDAKGVLFFNE